MKKLILSLILVSLTSAQAKLLELKNAQEFNELVQQSTVPVVVQFSAYWCNPCQMLKGVFETVAEDYTDSQVKIAYVDAYVNTSLKKYLMGGYPTVRTFKHAETTAASFVGSQSESQVRQFINGVISGRGDSLFCPVQ